MKLRMSKLAMLIGMILYIIGMLLLLPPMQRRARERNFRLVVTTPMAYMLIGSITFAVGYFAP